MLLRTKATATTPRQRSLQCAQNKYERTRNKASTINWSRLTIIRRNNAERAIHTWNNHFTAILCGSDLQFPLIYWDNHIPQGVITLNILQTSRVNPKLSTHAQLHSLFDNNCMPQAPLGAFTRNPINGPLMLLKASTNGISAQRLSIIAATKSLPLKQEPSKTADTIAWVPTTSGIPSPASNNRDF